MLFEILKRLKNENFYWTIGFYALVLAASTHFVFIWLFLYLDVPLLSFVNIVSVFIYLYCIFGVGLKTIESKDDRIIGWFVYFELIGHGSIATYYLGLESGFIYYIVALLLIPFFILNYSPRTRLFRVIGIIIVLFLLEVWGQKHPPVITLDSNYITILHYMNITIFLFTMAVISYFYTNSVYEYQNLLFKQSNVDALTDLYNRRYVDKLIEKNQRVFSSTDNLYGLLLIDIDFFKKINDSYGHKYGDNVLITLSRVLKTNVRQNTIVSRWGGEEFLIIVENTNKEELYHLAERLRTVVEKSILDEEKNIRITITLGGAIANVDEKFDSVLSRADKSLYRGKENGRNQVHILQ